MTTKSQPDDVQVKEIIRRTQHCSAIGVDLVNVHVQGGVDTML